MELIKGGLNKKHGVNTDEEIVILKKHNYKIKYKKYECVIWNTINNLKTHYNQLNTRPINTI